MGCSVGLFCFKTGRLVRRHNIGPDMARLKQNVQAMIKSPSSILVKWSSTTGYTRKSGIIILLYFFLLTSPHSSITTLLVNFGRSFSFRSTTISYTDFVSLFPSDKRCYVWRNDRYEVGVRDKKHENSLPLDLHGVKFERISRIFDPTF